VKRVQHWRKQNPGYRARSVSKVRRPHFQAAFL
jgi:hypothetical protein